MLVNGMLEKVIITAVERLAICIGRLVSVHIADFLKIGIDNSYTGSPLRFLRNFKCKSKVIFCHFSFVYKKDSFSKIICDLLSFGITIR